MYTLHKKISMLCSAVGKFSLLLVLFFITKPRDLFAQTVEIPFHPITTGFEGLFGSGEGITITSVLSSIFFLLIALGAIIAVLRIAISGITYMLSESFTSKESAKKGIQGSVLGLLLLLSVVLILNQIDSNLTDMAVLEGAPTAPEIEYTPSASQTPSTNDFQSGVNERVIPREDLFSGEVDVSVEQIAFDEDCLAQGGTPSNFFNEDDDYVLRCTL